MRLVGHTRIALMVGIVWNTDANDVDLHVHEPGGEACYYGNRRTKLGGTMSGDVTQGLGPELYCHAAPIPGRYRAWVRYFAPDRNRASTGTHVHVVVVRNWGTPRERSTRHLVRLASGNATHELAVLDVE